MTFSRDHGKNEQFVYQCFIIFGHVYFSMFYRALEGFGGDNAIVLNVGKLLQVCKEERLERIANKRIFEKLNCPL